MKNPGGLVLRTIALSAGALILLITAMTAQESATNPSQSDNASFRELNSQVVELRAAIEQMRAENAQSRAEMRELRQELQDTRKLLAPLAVSIGPGASSNLRTQAESTSHEGGTATSSDACIEAFDCARIQRMKNNGPTISKMLAARACTRHKSLPN